MPETMLALTDTLSSLALSAIVFQTESDKEYSAELDRFQSLLGTLSGSPYAALAEQLMPAQQVIETLVVECGFLARMRQRPPDPARAAGMDVLFVNSSLAKRHAFYYGTASIQIRMALHRVPLRPCSRKIEVIP
jgi:hypothetical protein